MTPRTTQVEANTSEWEGASFFGKWTFSFANPMLNAGMTKIIQTEDLLHVPTRYSSSNYAKILREEYKNAKAFGFLPRLMVAMIRMTLVDIVTVSVMALIDSGLMAIQPLFLQYLLEALLLEGDTSCYKWAAILSGTAIVQMFVRHALFFISMRFGWLWKNAATALIYDKLLSMDVNRLQNSGSSTGVMVNLISNDVARFEEFAPVRTSFIGCRLFASFISPLSSLHMLT
jgi:ABC-type multidrug transport system fused ATPase/permease subunit